MKGAYIACILAFALTSSVPTVSLAQTPNETAGQDEEKIVVGTDEILLDAIVKDKKGRPVRNLKPSDFEILEDGVPQQLKSFRLVTREPKEANTPNAPASEAARSPNPLRTDAPIAEAGQLGVVALVFDRLSPDARSQAQKAALDYIGEGLRADDFVGVFGIDLSLRVLQPFTNNTGLVRQAIEGAVAHAPSSYASVTDQISDLSQSQMQLADQSASSTATAGQGTSAGAVGAIAVQQAFNAMTLRTLEGYERLEHDQQGYATTNGLLAVINAMSRLPGRKTIIFFSEGVLIPPSVQAHFQSVISNANRANVSIYSVDAAGLRALSADAQAGRSLIALGQKRARQAGSATDSTDGPMMRDLERNEDLLRQNPNTGLGDLASQTGGLLINNTNNLGAKLRQIDEDLHSYYVLTYSPTNRNYDGRFRQITLKVDRPGVEVQTRKGYFAINASYGSPVLAYEAPALALLSGKSRPSAFPIRHAAFVFPSPGKPEIVSVLVEVPAGSIDYRADGEKKTYRANFSVVALVKDGSGQVVRKLSNQFLLTGKLDKVEEAKRGAALFYRETQLEPGSYTIDSAVFDANTGRASTSTQTIVVPVADKTKLQASSIVLIGRAERMAADQQSSNPFHFGEVLIYPNLGEPVRKSVSKNLAFYMTIDPAPGSTSPPKLNLEITQNTRAVGKATLDLPAPDQTGRIQYANALSIEKLPPGDYDLKVTVQDGPDRVTRYARFTIQP